MLLRKRNQRHSAAVRKHHTIRQCGTLLYLSGCFLEQPCILLCPLFVLFTNFCMKTQLSNERPFQEFWEPLWKRVCCLLFEQTFHGCWLSWQRRFSKLLRARFFCGLKRFCCSNPCFSTMKGSIENVNQPRILNHRVCSWNVFGFVAVGLHCTVLVKPVKSYSI